MDSASGWNRNVQPIIKVLITGANGMLGSSLCRLYEHTHDVYAFHRDGKCYAPCLTDFSLDLVNRGEVEKIFLRIKPDLVIHCAGLTNVDKCEKNPVLAYDANVTVTKHIAKICGKDAKLVYISSDQVYGAAVDHSESKTDLEPLNRYGKTKLLGEQTVREHSPAYIIIRTNIFGWNVYPEKTSSAEWMYRSLKMKQAITLFTDYVFSPLYTEYLGEIIIHLSQMNFSGVVNAGSSAPCSKYEFGMQLSEVFGLDKSLIIKGSITEHAFEAARADDLTLPSQKLVNLGIKVPNYRTSIERFYENRPRD